MSEFEAMFDAKYFGNTTWQWAVAAAIALVVFVYVGDAEATADALWEVEGDTLVDTRRSAKGDDAKSIVNLSTGERT